MITPVRLLFAFSLFSVVARTRAAAVHTLDELGCVRILVEAVPDVMTIWFIHMIM
jgi:hypothetical protein